jgi:hypothetical protein
MKYVLLALLTFSAFVSAEENEAKEGVVPSVWYQLDNVPASRYDIGRLHLDILTLQIKDSLIGKEVPNTHYSISYFGAFKFHKRLGFKMSYMAESQYIVPSDCDALLEHTKKLTPVTNLIPVIWPNLKHDGIEAQDIIDDFVHAAELINKDTNAVLATCHN